MSMVDGAVFCVKQKRIMVGIIQHILAIGQYNVVS